MSGGRKLNAGEVGETLKTLVSYMVDDSNEVACHVHESNSSVIFEVSVSEDDYGKVIGKNGKTASAMRTIVRAIAGAFNKRLILEFSFSK